jgi:hypothetical protein
VDSDGTANLLRFRAAAAFGLAGLPANAHAILSRAQERYPEATVVRTVLAPVTRASVALHDRRPDDAIEALRAAMPAELGTVAGLIPGYLRAEALRQKAHDAEALAEYEKVLRHRGVDPFAPVIALSQLGIARSRALSGDRAGARRAYDDLFVVWKNADAEFYPMIVARQEYARLTPPPSAAVSEP